MIPEDVFIIDIIVLKQEMIFLLTINSVIQIPFNVVKNESLTLDLNKGKKILDINNHQFNFLDCYKDENGNNIVFLVEEKRINYVSVSKNEKKNEIKELVELKHPISNRKLPLFKNFIFVPNGENILIFLIERGEIKLHSSNMDAKAIFGSLTDIREAVIAKLGVNQFQIAMEDYGYQDIKYLNLTLETNSSFSFAFDGFYKSKGLGALYYSGNEFLLAPKYYLVFNKPFGKRRPWHFSLMEEIVNNRTNEGGKWEQNSIFLFDSTISEMEMGIKFGIITQQNLLDIFMQGFTSFSECKNQFPIPGILSSKLIHVDWNTTLVLFTKNNKLFSSKIYMSDPIMVCSKNSDKSEKTLKIKVKATSPTCKIKRDSKDLALNNTCSTEVNFNLHIFKRGINEQKSKDTQLFRLAIITIVLSFIIIFSLFMISFCKTRRQLRNYQKLNNETTRAGNIVSTQEAENETKKIKDNIKINTKELPNMDKFGKIEKNI